GMAADLCRRQAECDARDVRVVARDTDGTRDALATALAARGVTPAGGHGAPGPSSPAPVGAPSSEEGCAGFPPGSQRTLAQGGDGDAAGPVVPGTPGTTAGTT